MANKEIVKIFKEIIQLLEIKGDKALGYKLKAYKNAINILDNLKIDVSEIYKEKGAKGIRELGIGEKNINKIDLLKFFLQLFWETKTMDNKNYAILSEEIFDLGKIMGGWKKKISQKNPPYF